MNSNHSPHSYPRAEESEWLVKSLVEKCLYEVTRVQSILSITLKSIPVDTHNADVSNALSFAIDALNGVVEDNKRCVSIAFDKDTHDIPSLNSNLLSCELSLEPQKNATTIGSRIREIRKSRGITQKDIAELVGVTPSCVTQWESGLISPNCDKLIPLAKALGCDPLWLIGK